MLEKTLRGNRGNMQRHLYKKIALITAILVALSGFSLSAFAADGSGNGGYGAAGNTVAAPKPSAAALKANPDMARSPVIVSDGTSMNGYIPPQTDESPINDYKDYPQLGETVPEEGSIAEGSTRLRASSVPAGITSFNWRDDYDNSKSPIALSDSPLPAARDQGNFGDCWAFATLLSAESSLAINQVESSVPTLLSPYHLVYSVFNSKTYYSASASSAMQTGANFYYAGTALSKWFGPQTEAAYPYPQNESENKRITDISKLASSAYHLRDMKIFPSPRSSKGIYIADNISAIKAGVYNYGPLGTGYYAGDSLNDYVTAGGVVETTAYYYSGDESANHGVTIVGWDDNYSKDNFKTTPPGDGAFLIQNSWGSGFGDDGYFWMSYYDHSIGTSAHFSLGPTDDYTYLNYLDDLGYGASITSSTKSSVDYMANIFTATGADAVYGIGAATVFTNYPNTTYTISVYSLPTAGNPASGTKIDIAAGAATSVTAKEEYAGYHTIDFDLPAYVGAGEKFSVVVKVTKANKSDIPLTFEYSSNSKNYMTRAAGQSYYSSTGTSWTDLYYTYSDVGNFNIRALSNTAESPTIKIDPKAKPAAYIQKGKALDLTKSKLILTYKDGRTESFPLNSPNIKVSGYSKNKVGKQTVTVKFRGATRTFTVNVVNYKIKTNKSTYTVKSKKSVTPKITVTSSGKKISKKTAGLKYKSSNTAVAKVSSSGKVTAKKVKKTKTCTITITAKSGLTKKIKIKVKP
jgi:C1A family cysteine protease